MSQDIRRMSFDEISALNEAGRAWRDRNKQSVDEPDQERPAILPAVSQEPAIGEQMDLLF
jgi:hypothetical protein